MHQDLTRPGGPPPLVVLAQSSDEPDQFVGLDAPVHRRGLRCDRLMIDRVPVWPGGRASVVVVKDVRSAVSAYALEQARRVGAVSVLLMDGIVEWRNTFINPHSGPDFLRPAPVDVVACCGEMDRRTLAALGNDAVVTGLPRLYAAFRALPARAPLPERRAIMVATANRAAFDDAERSRLSAALREIKDAAIAAGVEVCWRLTGGLDAELGVAQDLRPLPEALLSVRGVVTTPSTLMVESMLAGRPTALLHAHPTPLWQPATWIWTPGAGAIDPPWQGAGSGLAGLHADLRALSRTLHDPGELIASLLEPDAGQMDRQGKILALMCHPRPPVEALADLLKELALRPRHATHGRRMPPQVRTPAGAPAPRRPRIVNCVFCDGSPVGGVQTWAFRLGEAFAREDLGYDVRTLLVTPHLHALPDDPSVNAPGSLVQACVYDPLGDHTSMLATVRDAIAGLEPAVVLPNYTDICYMAAALLRRRGVRTIAVAHTDEDYYRALLGVYNRWDAAVAVSGACAQWLAPMAGARPLETIPYGVPVAERPREVPDAGPLTMAYFGRMVQRQKRIFDLLGVIDGLERRAVPYVLHMIGDGTELEEWRRRLGSRRLAHGRVEIHGRREPSWVERFLPTVDVSVLVSEYEGTSVSMLEAMGAGVVPVITRVRSGAEEWVRDGQSGVLCPIGEPDAMAARLAALALDRPGLRRMGRAAWETARERAGVGVMARAYARVFDRAMTQAPDATPSDLGLRPMEPWRWAKRRADDPAAAERWLRAALREAGYAGIALDRPEPGCDAVLVRTDRPDRPTADEVSSWRARGLGVVHSPGLRADPPGEHVRDALAALRRDGRTRIAVFGAGKHTRALGPIFCDEPAVVGYIDDHPPAWGTLFGLPVVTLDRAVDDLAPDAVLLSSDAWERQMWERCAGLRRAGVRVVALYGVYGEAALKDHEAAVA